VNRNTHFICITITQLYSS